MEKELLFNKILERFHKNESVVLCCIVEASGSSPRGTGAMMAVFRDGEIAGTVGGGAVEQHAIALASEILKSGKSQQKSYCLTPNEVADIGMVCGGNVTVQFVRMDATEQNAALFSALPAAMDAPRQAWLVMKLTGESITECAVYDAERGLLFSKTMTEAELLPRLSDAPTYDGSFYTVPVSDAGTVFVFGGGHVGAALVPILHTVGFHVTLYDNREQIAKKENFPFANRVIFGDYQNISEHIEVKPEDYVVILTPGHLGDRAVLLQAMRTQASYIGCIGSRSKIAATNAFLLENGIAEAELSRIHAPIGLAIGAKTPQEIAVSIAAELIAHRANEKKEKPHGI